MSTALSKILINVFSVGLFIKSNAQNATNFTSEALSDPFTHEFVNISLTAHLQYTNICCHANQTNNIPYIQQSLVITKNISIFGS